MRARFTTRLALVGLLAVLASCGGNSNEPTPNPDPGPLGEEPTHVRIPSSDGYGESSFSPGSVTIAVGKTVSWDNDDSLAHTTTSDTWNGTIGPRGSYRRTFSAAGTFNYRCTIHAGMDGTVIVQ